MKTAIPLVCAAFALDGCVTEKAYSPVASKVEEAQAIIHSIRSELLPDSPLKVFRVTVEPREGKLVLAGQVDSTEARTRVLTGLQSAKIKVKDELQLVPDPALGSETWGIACLSTANGREQTQHKAELGTQLLMGEAVRILQQTNHGFIDWYLVQGPDGYVAWQQKGNVVRCSRAAVDAWLSGPLLVVTGFHATVLSEPRFNAEPVCNLVLLNRVQNDGESGDFYKVKLPDGRGGFLEKSAAEDYSVWKSARVATPENIERSALLFLGRPYLWGGNSPAGIDCSGFTKLVFALNGVDLLRNASHQCTQGKEVPLDDTFSAVHKGDLLFFGRRAAGGQWEKVTHVGIYLGDRRFIHSAEMVRISSLDPNSPDRDARHSSRLLRARRILKD